MKKAGTGQDSLAAMLSGGDLRSIGKANTVVENVRTQRQFDVLFSLLFDGDRKVVMRAADAIEKITQSFPRFLGPHKKEILDFLISAGNIEFKWHLALLVPRLKFTKVEAATAWKVLSIWLMDSKESKIVRVNSLQGMCGLLQKFPAYQGDFQRMTARIHTEKVPSLEARLKKLC